MPRKDKADPTLSSWPAADVIGVDVCEQPLAMHLPDATTLRPVPLAIAVVGALLLFAARWSVLRVLGVCAVLGLVAGLTGLPIT